MNNANNQVSASSSLLARLRTPEPVTRPVQSYQSPHRYSGDLIVNRSDRHVPERTVVSPPAAIPPAPMASVPAPQPTPDTQPATVSQPVSQLGPAATLAAELDSLPQAKVRANPVPQLPKSPILPVEPDEYEVVSEVEAQPQPVVVEDTPASFMNWRVWPVVQWRGNMARKLERAVPRLNRWHSQIKGVNFGQYTASQVTVAAVAGLLFVGGLIASFQTVQANRQTAAQVAAIAGQVSGRRSVQTADAPTNGPAVTKPSVAEFNGYTVAADAPRYIKNDKIGLNARVTAVNAADQAKLGAPGNVNDAAWQTDSAKPGATGATVISGYVASGASSGAFYGLGMLSIGDTVQVERGDKSVLNYKVVRTQLFTNSDQDIKAATSPVTPGKSGLSLVSCVVGSGQRILILAEQF